MAAEGRGAAALRSAEVVLLACVTLTLNLRGWTHGRFAEPVTAAMTEAVMDVILAGSALLLLWRSGRLQPFSAALRSAWPLTPFLAFGGLSIIWSIDAVATAARTAQLISGLLLAAYVAARYSLREALAVVGGMFGGLAVLSVMAALSFPGIGTMEIPPYDGSWNGIFWHRNYLGSTMAAASIVFLLAALAAPRLRSIRALVFGVLYFLGLALVGMSRSATGLILVLILHGILGLIAAWIRWRKSLRAIHYWLGAGGLVSLEVFILGNLGPVLGLFNRTPTFTGRTRLWEFLLDQVVAQRPILGHGLGTLWTSPSFHLAVQRVVGWPYPVFIGDNGYVDLLLQVGAVGLVLLVIALIWAGIVSVRCLGRWADFAAAAPVLFLAYVVVTNITLSYFAETETFIWFVLLALVLAASCEYARQGRTARISTSSDA